MASAVANWMILRLAASFRQWSTLRPLTSASAVGFTVMSAGDAAAQKQEGAKSLDMRRNLCSAAYNGCASPVFYRWYRFMDWLMPASTLRALVPKTILSQIVTTGGNNPAYLVWCNHVEAFATANGAGVDWAAVRKKTSEQLMRELPNLYGGSLLFWLPVTGANFALVPDHLRILWISSCSVLWGGFVSYVAHREAEAQSGDVSQP